MSSRSKFASSIGGTAPLNSLLEYLTARFTAGEYQTVRLLPPVMSAPADPVVEYVVNGDHCCSIVTLIVSKSPAGTLTVSVVMPRTLAWQRYMLWHAASRTRTDGSC